MGRPIKILFGDVWVCSGQSNMEFSVAEAFDRDDIIATAGLPGLRLFAVQKNGSTAEIDDLQDVQTPGGGWVRSSPSTVCGAEYDNDGYSPSNTSPYCGPHCGPSAAVKSFHRATWGYFSAACFLHGRALLRETQRPQGMIESCWGGTRIESWSSAAALQACSANASTGGMGLDYMYTGYGDDVDVHDAGANPSELSTSVSRAGGTLWNGMIVPLLRFPIRGAIWYQGEANARSTASGNLYYCQMAAMVADWRARWIGNPTRDFAFIIAALAPAGGAASPVVRYSQWGTAATSFFRSGPAVATAATAPTAPVALGSGQAPVPALNNVGVANLIDLFDQTSPCGAVHIRNKTTVGERLARAALALDYNMSDVTWAGPVPAAITRQGAEITVSYASSDPGSNDLGLEFVTLDWNNQTAATAAHWQNFEVLLNSSTGSGTGGWTRVQAAVAADGASVKLSLLSASAAVAALRYAWAETPIGQQLFSFNGRGLPALPFIAGCSAAGCKLYPAGGVPNSAGPGPAPPPVPPAPPAPPSGACSFANHTDVHGAQSLAALEVGFMDTQACCGACRAYTGCVVAVMYGSGTPSPPYTHSNCALYGTTGNTSSNKCAWPCARVRIAPLH